MKKHLKVVIVVVMAFALTLLSIVGMSTLGSNTAKAESITVHFKWSGDNPHLYFENVNGESDTSASYPGVPMKDEQNGWYSYTITNAKSASVQISVPSMSFQTATCERESGEWWFDEGTWYTSNPDSDGASVSVAGEDTSKGKNNIVQVNYNEASSVNAEAGNITVHFVSDWHSASIYYWNSLPQNLEVEWPGKNMSKDSNGYFTYSFDSVNKINLLFTNGSEQTEDLTLANAGEYWYKDGNWTSYDPANAPTPTPIPTDGPITTPAPFARTDFRDESIYFVMTTRFYDGDSGNNAHCRGDQEARNGDDDPAWRGDFKGLIQKLDYIKALGFSAVWITPVVKNDSDYDYHGYHAVNFKQVDSRYESSDTSYQDLINAAHEKGIKIIQDVVFNHTCNFGEENLTLSNRDSSTADRISQLCGTEYYHDKMHLGGGDWETYLVQTGIMANDCIDLETENPKVYNYLIDAYNQYIKMGVDAFRIDTVKHISRLTFNKTFLPAFKETGGDKFFMFGEACVLRHEIWNSGNPGISVPFYTWKEQENYAWTENTAENEALVAKHYTDNKPDKQPTSDNAFLKGNDYHTPDRSQSSGMDMIDFFMHWSFVDAKNAFQKGLEEDQYFNDATWNVTYVDSHDYAPDTAPADKRFVGTQDTWAENLDLMFTFRGIPCIYYGSEIEFMKGAPIDKGTTMPLSKTGRAYFGDHIEGSINTTDFGVYSNVTGEMATTLNYPLAKHVQRLNLIRRAVPALRKGQYSREGVDGNMAFKRRYTEGGTDSFVCVAISDSATFSGVPSGTYVDMVSGKSVQCDGTLSITVSGKGNMGVYVLQTAGAPDGKIGENGTYLK